MKALMNVVAAVAVFLSFLLLSGPAHAADPTTADCLGANDSSISLRNEHKLRAARAQLLVCAAANCPADVRSECGRRVSELNAAMPTVVFEAKDASGKDLGAVKVTMDGQMLAERLEGTALSIDPGEHAFVFETAGQPPLSKQIIIREGEKDRRVAVVLGEVAPQPGAPTATQKAVPVAPATSSKASSNTLGVQRSAAIAALGVGAVGVVVGAIFGVKASSNKATARSACPNLCADQAGVEAWNTARTAGNVSTVGFIVGGVGLAGGALLWFTSKHESESRVEVGMGLGSLHVKGAW